MSTTPNPWPDPPVGSPDRRPVSRASNFALLFALLPLAGNLIVNVTTLVLAGRVAAGGDVSGLVTFGVVLVAIGTLATLALVVLSVINIVRAWRETAGGHLRGRVRTIVALVLCAFHVVSTVVALAGLPGVLASA